MPESRPVDVAKEQLWPLLNRKRGQLIDKQIGGIISDAEQQLLDVMNAYADEHLARIGTVDEADALRIEVERQRQVIARLSAASQERGGLTTRKDDLEHGSIAWWIDRVDTVVSELPQMGAEPLLDKAIAIAHLRQAEALERIARALESSGPTPYPPTSGAVNATSLTAQSCYCGRMLFVTGACSGCGEHPDLCRCSDDGPCVEDVMS